MIAREHAEAFERFDVLVSPTSPTVAFELGEKAADPLAMYLSDLLTIPSCMAGLPGLNVPCGLSDGLPVGLQLIGPQLSENTLFKAGHALERARLRPRAGAAERDDLAAGRRAGDPRPAEDAGRRCSAAARTASVAARTRRPARCASASPGRCPVINRRAIEWTIKLGLALCREIAPHAVFARKNYFYPDLPKGYQISQHDRLLHKRQGARADTDGDHEIGIVRAHLEEDAAKTRTSAGALAGSAAPKTLVDFNRGGTPLVEIVTGPDVHSAEEARRFLQLLRQTIVELGISDAEMEKGSPASTRTSRCAPRGRRARTRCELKNMNSFRFVAQGIDAEVARQTAVYEGGGRGRPGDL